MKEEYFTLQEVSNKLKTPVAYLRKMIKEHRLKAHLMGRNYKCTESEVNEYVKSCGVKNDR